MLIVDFDIWKFFVKLKIKIEKYYDESNVIFIDFYLNFLVKNIKKCKDLKKLFLV